MANTEMRETEWLASGDRVLPHDGVWWTVKNPTRLPDGRVSLVLIRTHHGRAIEEVTVVERRDHLWRTLDTTPRGGSLRSEK